MRIIESAKSFLAHIKDIDFEAYLFAITCIAAMIFLANVLEYPKDTTVLMISKTVQLLGPLTLVIYLFYRASMKKAFDGAYSPVSYYIQNWRMGLWCTLQRCG